MECYSCKSENVNILSDNFLEAYFCNDCGFGSHIFKPDYCCPQRKIVNIRFEQSNGTIVQRTACENCKKLIKGTKKKDINFNNYRLLSQDRYLHYEKERNDSYDRLSQSIKTITENFKNKRTDHFWQQYNTYLKSDIWLSKRDLVLKRDNYICQGCLSAKSIHVHHTTYDNVFDELLFQLISLCLDCHSKLHPDKPLS